MNNTAAVNSKESAQFHELYNSESDAVFRFCFIRVSDHEQALDLTQETFTRLWQSLIQGKSIENGRAFLFTVAHRLIIDWYRKKKAVSLESLSIDDETRDPYEPADEKTHDGAGILAEGRFLLEKINELDQSYRQAVYLRFVEGMSPPEIGDILGISANAASVRINRGLRELRKITGYSPEQIALEQSPGYGGLPQPI
jgi:RNA polymerase sigma-70 factor (ECF subfamily)